MDSIEKGKADQFRIVSNDEGRPDNTPNRRNWRKGHLATCNLPLIITKL